MTNILVTGSNSGVGLACARAFAAAGHTVFATLRDPSRAAPLEELRREGLPVTILKLDVTDPASIEDAMRQAEAQGGVEVLVNNAGFEVVSPVEQLTDELMLRQFDTNVFGLVRMTRAVLPAMRAKRSGHIVNMSSVVGHISTPNRGAYSASKHAVEGFTKSLWLEARPFGINVTSIVLGAIATNFVANYVYADDFDESSPYWAIEEKLGTAPGKGKSSPHSVSAETAAAAALDVIEGRNADLHVLVGSSAEALIPKARALGFEDFANGWLPALRFTVP